MSTVDAQVQSPIEGANQSATILQLAMAALRLTKVPGTDSNNNLQQRLRPVISLSEVAYHDCYDDCWIVLYDRVYDITNFLRLVSSKRYVHVLMLHLDVGYAYLELVR